MPTTKTTKRKTTKAAPRKTAAPVKEQTVELTEAQWATLLQTYTNFKAAGLDIPAEIAKPVEAWLAAEKAKEEVVAEATEAADALQEEQDATGPKWVRSCYRAPFSLRLQRQDKKQRIELAPRGQRGDMHPLLDEDLSDHILINNLNTGLIELIGDGEAKRIAEGQTTHIQKHDTTLAMIRNENGQPIEKLVVEQEYNKQGVVVGYIDPNAGKKAPLGGIVRPGDVEQVSHFVPTMGNPAIVSSGFAPAPISDNAQAQIADNLARLKGIQGRPEDVLSLSVSVDPVQKT